MARAAKKNTDFASTLTELEQIVTRLETGDLPLEEALTAFERGIVLAREGQQRLAQAEQRVQILLSDNPNAELTPYPTDSQS